MLDTVANNVQSQILPSDNRLLAALSVEIQERIFPHLELVPMPLGEVLYESGDTLKYVYFPKTSIISLINVLTGHPPLGIALIGNEGMLDAVVVLGR